MVIQLNKFSKNHWTIDSQWVNFMARKLYFNKTAQEYAHRKLEEACASERPWSLSFINFSGNVSLWSSCLRQWEGGEIARLLPVFLHSWLALHWPNLPEDRWMKCVCDTQWKIVRTTYRSKKQVAILPTNSQGGTPWYCSEQPFLLISKDILGGSLKKGHTVELRPKLLIIWLKIM